MAGGIVVGEARDAEGTRSARETSYAGGAE